MLQDKKYLIKSIMRFFTNDPSVMRKLNNLESIQKKYIDILQNLYNLYIPDKDASLKLLTKNLYHM